MPSLIPESSLLLLSRLPRPMSFSWVAGEGTESLRGSSAGKEVPHPLPLLTAACWEWRATSPFQCEQGPREVGASVSSPGLLGLVSCSVGSHGHDLESWGLTGLRGSQKRPESPALPYQADPSLLRATFPPPKSAPWGWTRHEYFSVCQESKQPVQVAQDGHQVPSQREFPNALGTHFQILLEEDKEQGCHQCRARPWLPSAAPPGQEEEYKLGNVLMGEAELSTFLARMSCLQNNAGFLKKGLQVSDFGEVRGPLIKNQIHLCR
ncbi:uncharacterized protein LOC116663291 [Camelus ferus]|uniref:Uncharacterized protein LOC116663291 n=1 Tax=Camelus ferus TaxID=419612 RepID=A0A8B8SWX8_CAMFR|nr:uncharacterized protein LOC116663291 [Camelus ferus]